jgi:hypothetical protein
MESMVCAMGSEKNEQWNHDTHAHETFYTTTASQKGAESKINKATKWKRRIVTRGEEQYRTQTLRPMLLTEMSEHPAVHRDVPVPPVAFDRTCVPPVCSTAHSIAVGKGERMRG